MKTASKTVKELEKQLALAQKQVSESEKEAESIRKKLEAEKNKNKPKNITDLVKSYEDACAFKGVKPTLSYEKRNGRSIASIAHDRLEFTFSVLNEGYVFKMDVSEARWFIWWELDSSSPSGLRFVSTAYPDDYVAAASAAHLCFFTPEDAKDAALKFPEVYSGFLGAKLMV